MNPSVINHNNNGGGNGGNTNGDHSATSASVPPHQNAQSSDANTSHNNNNNNNNSNNNNNHNTNTRTSSDPRGFPSPFSSTGRFAFDDSDDDMFGDLDMRARMNRLGGFDWGGHKRRGSGAGFPDASNYDQFFQNDFHQFPGFNNHMDAFNRAKPAAQSHDRRAPTAHPTSGSPSVDRGHFFNHVPEEFRHYFPESFGSSFSRMRPQQSQHQSAAQSPPSHPSMMRQPHPPPRAEPQQYYQQPAAAQRVPMEFVARPKMSDAAIQTDILPAEQTPNNLNQHGLRNTVDLGQKSQPELINVDRSQSAPPTEPQTPISANKAGADGLHSNTGTSMTPQSSTAGNQNQFNYSQPPTAPSHQAPPQSPPGAAGNRTRTVPIQLEGRPAAPQQPIPAPAPQRPEPFTPKQESDVVDSTNDGPPPQTPHTSDCINKIQSIQTDVLDLMGAVDRFSGSRGDKEYMYIDEMLTRNLLKLDTIDTNGRESIRLARKEAIRCIQASITVLEAKAEQNSNKKKAAAAEKQAAEVEAPTPTEAEVPAPEAAAAPVAEAPADNIEQSLEEKLADFQRKSEEREVAATAPEAAEAPVTHVSEVSINLNGA